MQLSTAQKECLAFFAEKTANAGAILPPGAGKTRILLADILQSLNEGRIDHALVITDSMAAHDWIWRKIEKEQRENPELNAIKYIEADKWRGEREYNLIVFSCRTISSPSFQEAFRGERKRDTETTRTAHRLRDLLKEKRKRIAFHFDEVGLASNTKTTLHKWLARETKGAGQFRVYDGTPNADGWIKLHGILKLLDPENKIYPCRTLTEFKKVFCVMEQKWIGERRQIWVITGYKDIDIFAQYVNALCYSSFTKPGEAKVVHKFQAMDFLMKNEEKLLYDMLKKGSHPGTRGDTAAARHPVARQYEIGVLNGEVSWEEPLRAVKAVKCELGEKYGTGGLIFCWHRDVAEVLGEYLKVPFVYGGLDKAKVSGIMKDTYAKDDQSLVLTFSTGSQSLDFDRKAWIIIAEPCYWNRLMEQAKERIQRKSQINPVLEIRFLVFGELNKVVYENQSDKKKMMEELERLCT